MSIQFVIEDDFHAEIMGRFQTRADALDRVARLAETPFTQSPNMPPCVAGDRCCRKYYLIEYDTETVPWTKLSAKLLLSMTANSVVVGGPA